MTDLERLNRRAERERAARKQAETLLEEKSRELFIANQELIQAKDELEARVRDRTEKLEAALEKAEASTRAKSEFLANMSHEIRTPMTSILGFTDLLMEEGDQAIEPERRNDAIQAVRRNGEHLLKLINDILDISKIESSRLEMESSVFSPIGILNEVKSLMIGRADEKSLALEIEYQSKIPATIESDPTRIRQILINLVGNAIKFTELGSVCIIVRLVTEDLPRLEFDFVDTGIGMTEEQMDRLFKPFSQADQSTTRKYGGSGLGLTISKRLANILGGDVSIVKSSLGKGTTTRFSLALGDLDEVAIVDADDAHQSIQTSIPSSQSTPDALKNCKILLAEDGKDNQRLIGYLLRRSGAEVELVENGKDALDKAIDFERRGQSFDVVLMDMQMPVMDGYDATRRLRDSGFSEPIIALTAHAMSGDRQKCLDVGCDDYVSKPIDRSRLIDVIHSMMRASKRRSSEDYFASNCE